jgi:hypothetical protein
MNLFEITQKMEDMELQLIALDHYVKLFLLHST